MLLATLFNNFDKFYDGIYRFIIGLCKKVILANNLGVIWYSILATLFTIEIKKLLYLKNPSKLKFIYWYLVA